MESMVPKIAQVRKMLDEARSTAWLEVDGGITPANISRVRAAGADTIVAAYAIFKHPDGIAAGIQALRSVVTT
jgi:ribulose-phosphate 3-epimerase